MNHLCLYLSHNYVHLEISAGKPMGAIAPTHTHTLTWVVPTSYRLPATMGISTGDGYETCHGFTHGY